MSALIPSSNTCCDPCSDPTNVLVPGPQGTAGTNGTNGTNGVNAYTTLSASFTMPAEGANVTATVGDSTWMVATQVVYVGTAGYMEVQSKPSSTQVILKNLENTASSLYTANAAAGTSIPNGSSVSPAGIQGPATSASVAITGGTIDGTSVGATTRSSGAFTTLDANSDATLSGKLFFTSSAIQSLLAAGTISPNATRIRVTGNGGAVTLTSTPTITSPSSDGQLLIIQGTDNTNTVTLQDESGLAGSKLELGAATRVLGKGDQILLIWDNTDTKWYEIGFANN